MLLKLFAKPLPAFSRALEIGCGFGEGIALVRQDLGAEEVWALDFDFDMVSHCALAAISSWKSFIALLSVIP